jgi:hypothetical protein
MYLNNFYSSFRILVLTVFVAVTNQCLPKSNTSDNNLPLLLLLQTIQSQASGAGNPTCIALRKSSSNLYDANGYNVASSDCNAANLTTIKFFTDPAAARAEYVTQIDAANLIYAGKSSCFSKSSDLLSEKSATRTQNNNSSGFPFLANSGSGCVYLGAFSNTNTSFSGSLFTNTIVYCKDESSLSAIKTLFRTDYTSGSVLSDMKKSLDYYKGMAVGSPKASNNPGWGLKSTAAQNIRLATLAELKQFRSASGRAILAFLNSSSSTCVQEILDADSSLRILYTASTVYGKSSDKDAVTQAIAETLSCNYGTSATETTNAGVCPSSNVYQTF